MPRSSLLEKQWALYEEGQYDDAFAQTREVLETLPLSERRDAYRLLGLARYGMGMYLEAVHWFRELCEGSDVADDWCRLAMAAVMRGDMHLAEESFEQVRLCHGASRHSQRPGLYLHLFWYASTLYEKGLYDAAQPLVDELAQAYRRLHRTDGGHLLAQGMPLLSSFLSLAVEVFRAQHRHAQGTAWLEELARGLDAAGQKQVGRAMRELAAPDLTDFQEQ